jgi:hypothetical protein
VVIIGRNEGERLVRCFASLGEQRTRPVVYVDSGSSDDSVANARRVGASVVELDMSTPFSAARARNAGWRLLAENHPEVEYVQFVDGDMEVQAGWLEAAEATLDAEPDVSVVFGHRRERRPEASVYNRICDVEWGKGGEAEVEFFGGDAMARIAILQQVGGYNPSVIAGEELDLAFRIRTQTGTRIKRIDHDSTLHDAAMTKATQWWTRIRRGGHAYAQVHSLHRAVDGNPFGGHVRRSLVWGAAAPAAAAALALPTLGLSVGVVASRYPLAGARAALKAKKDGFGWTHALVWGASCALAPFPEALGVAQYHWNQLQGKAPKIIEHKGPGA